MLSEQTKNKFQLQVVTELDCLQDVLVWFEKSVGPYLPQKVAWQCEVALAEAFTNAVRHAHQELPASTPIDLEVELLPNFLEIKVWDWGQPFDLEAQLIAHEEDLNSVEKEGGRGLQFIKKLTDELQYFPCPDQRNCLVIRKKY